MKNINSLSTPQKAVLAVASDDKQSFTITLTKNELETFLQDWEQGYGSWSDTSYRICIFLGIDPTDGV